MAGPTTLIRSKTRVPAVAHAVIARGRVVGELVRAAEGRRIVEVVASAGSGKTTAVVQFLATRPGACAWLTVGEADGSPGRLVMYLAAALEAIEPDAPVRVGELLADGVPAADCAAMLAESMRPGTTLVIDDVHEVEHRPPVLAVLRALTGAVAPDALIVLISRRRLSLDLSRSVLTGEAGAVSGRELAFTSDEVGELLAAHRKDGSPDEIAEVSGGWAAGIVFDALHGARPAGVGEDPFFEYLGAEVLEPLAADVRHAVIQSAVLHTVDPHGLAAILDLASGEAVYGAILRQHLPATLEPEGLRYHPRFREFLLSLLRREPERLSELLVRHARRLASEGQVEEAADHLIEAGALDEAAEAVEAAGRTLLVRGDWEKLGGWCDALGDERLSRQPALRGLQLLAYQTGRRNELPGLVRRLMASGEYERLAREAPDAATTAVFGLHMSGDWEGVQRYLPPDEASPGARAMRYVLEVGSGSDPPRPWRVADLDSVPYHVGLLQCALYFQGRLDEVEEMARIDQTTAGPGSLTRTRLYEISSLCRRGSLGDARIRYEAGRPYISRTGFRDFWEHAEGELLFAEGDRERGLKAVRDARLLARERGHQPADRAIFAATEGKMLVRMGRTDEAVELLRGALAWCEERVLPCFGEWAATWLATAQLQRGDDPLPAARMLERAVAGMDRAERRLEQPAALVQLAEARWRLGDEEGHDAAAAAARAATEAMGSLGPLLTALQDAPDVLARCIDAGGPGAAGWRALARAGEASRTATSVEGARIVIGTLGRLRLDVDGTERHISPPRAIDVAAEVARAGMRGLSRDRLVEVLAEHSIDAQNYLRQVIHRLRRVAPEGVELTSEDGLLRWTPAGAVVTEDGVLRSLLARAGRETGEARLRTLFAALELAEGGLLVTTAETASAQQLRDELAAEVVDARREHADLLLLTGRSVEAVAAARAAVTAEPLREDGWRLLMRAAAAAYGPAAAVPVYAECGLALAQIGLGPSPATRSLLDRLRAADSGVVSSPG